VSLSASDVDRILQLLDASSFDELELEMEGLKLSLRRSSASAVSEPTSVAATLAPPVVVPSSATSVSVKPAAGPALSDGETTVNAPLFGTFYRAPKPGAAPYVAPGSAVSPDTVIGIIEVMKLMNTVRAGIAGTVTQILITDGSLVEFGSPLICVRPSS
jgi:acetyl-CoA carboxylase biotin carboxyl carrier protein